MASRESEIEMDVLSEEKDTQRHLGVRGILNKSLAGMRLTQFFDKDKVEVGLRVVRAMKWDKGEVDGGKGNVGTVVEILDDAQQVRVQWDSQDTLNAAKNGDKFTYSTGKDDKYDLLVFDSAQAGVKHERYSCDGCYESPIRGMRWHCLDCHDYDLCTRCYMYDVHDVDHAFERHQGHKLIGVNVGTRADASEYEMLASGIFIDEKVTSRKEPEQKGVVTDIEDDIVTLYNCDAKVDWTGKGLEGRYRVGREGEVDIKFTKPAEKKYFQNHLQEINGDNAVIGTRVVKRSDEDHVTVGTITSVKNEREDSRRGGRRINKQYRPRESLNLQQKRKSQTHHSLDENKCPLTVQWDDGRKEEDVETSSREILLFDNSQIGINHDVACDVCGYEIIGMRWECSVCPYSDLCTSCYMLARDGHVDHLFHRITEPDNRTGLETTRGESGIYVKTALGIFEGAKVQDLESNAGIEGEVKEVCHYSRGNARCIAVVETDKNEEIKGPLTDFRSKKDNKSFFYYASHLPVLGKDIQGYAIVEDKHKNKIAFELWYRKDNPISSSEVQHSLYLIFANKPEDNSQESSQENEKKLLKDVKKFAKKSHLPCQLAIQKVLFLDKEVVIHKDTTKDTIQTLVEMGVRKFVRGVVKEDEDEDEDKYFLRMSKYLSGKCPLPTFISLCKGGPDSINILPRACKNNIPVICFKKNRGDVKVLTKMDKDGDNNRTKTYKIDLKNPWKVTEGSCERSCANHGGVEEDITAISDMPDESENMAALISNLLIGVCIYKPKESHNSVIFTENRRTCANVLSMYLLRSGKWKIPKTSVENSLHYRSIEFIFEEKMTKEFKDGLWKDLESKTKLAYVAPKWKTEGKDTALEVKSSDLLGLVFFALLKKRYYDGAKQLFETGCVQIPDLLIGCVILQEAANDWQTSQLQKENILRMKKLCTQQALRITSGIHDTDRKNKRKTTDVMKSRQPIDHACRLLLNHGYVSDAIKTENSAYLNDEVVQKVIYQMWYKNDSISIKRSVLFIFLTLIHFLVLPILMVNRKIKPLKWLYLQYQLPVMKVLLNAFSIVMVLTALSYMLIYNFTEEITRTDWFIIAWMTSLFVDETKLIIISCWRRKIRDYFADWWNGLDWMIMITYLCGMLVKFGSSEVYTNASKVLLVLTSMLMYVRFLNLLMVSEIIGAKLVMIKKMFVDTAAFLSILLCIGACYSISYYAILYSGNREFGDGAFGDVFGNGFWIIFGENALEEHTLREPDCTFDKAIYILDEIPRCPSELGRELSIYMKGSYAAFTCILLLNLLIAIYSHTVAEVHEKSKFYWAFVQTDVLEEYSLKTIFPIHFQLLVLAQLVIRIPFIISRLVNGNGDDEDDDQFDQEPEFIRVFLYDTNFDLKLPETREAEVQAALRVSGVLSVADEDKQTDIRKKIKKINDKVTLILKEIRCGSKNSKEADTLGRKEMMTMMRSIMTESLDDSDDDDEDDYEDWY